MILSSLDVQYKVHPQIDHQQYFIKNSFLKPYLQQRLLRIPGGGVSVEEEEEVGGKVQLQVEGTHHHQSRLSQKRFHQPLVPRVEILKFGDPVDLSPPCN